MKGSVGLHVWTYMGSVYEGGEEKNRSAPGTNRKKITGLEPIRKQRKEALAVSNFETTTFWH